MKIANLTNNYQKCLNLLKKLFHYLNNNKELKIIKINNKFKLNLKQKNKSNKLIKIIKSLMKFKKNIKI